MIWTKIHYYFLWVLLSVFLTYTVGCLIWYYNPEQLITSLSLSSCSVRSSFIHFASIGVASPQLVTLHGEQLECRQNGSNLIYCSILSLVIPFSDMVVIGVIWYRALSSSNGRYSLIELIYRLILGIRRPIGNPVLRNIRQKRYQRRAGFYDHGCRD